MINKKGEWIYTNAEIAYELGLSPTTVSAIGIRLFGNRIQHWTVREAKLIAEYISVEEDAKRLALLHETIASVGFYNVDDERVKNDLRNVP